VALGLRQSGPMSAAPWTFYPEIGRLAGAAKPSLLALARQGDREAFTEMVTPHMPTVYQRAWRLTGNAADAEDVSQEALLKAWSRLAQFSGKQDGQGDDFRAWLARIAGNTSIDVLRHRRDGKILSLEEQWGPNEETLGGGIPAREDNPEERCARRETGRTLADAIKQLPADLRQACLLRDVLQYSTQEVAERLGISVVAVRLRLFRAHRRLREKLQNATRRSGRRAEQNAMVAETRHERFSENKREKFLPMSAAAEYACGD
jgi:RNA polymerase sigma-70 factor (ECF subfamily)